MVAAMVLPLLFAPVRMDPERFHSAYRTALIVVLIYLLWMIAPHAVRYTSLVTGGARGSQKTEVSPGQKLSATDLAVKLRAANRLGEDTQLRCEPATRDWDYICSYIPTALQTNTRLHFGVNVDATRWTNVSSVVPVGTAIAPPH